MKTIKTWRYQYPLRKRTDWIFTGIRLVLITDLIIAAVIFIAQPSKVLANLMEYQFVFWIIAAVYLLVGLLMVSMNEGIYLYSYELNEKELVVSSGGGYSAAYDHTEHVNSRIGGRVQLEQVRKLMLHKTKNKIGIRGFLTVTSVYADDEELLQVWDTLCHLCASAKTTVK